MARVLIGNFKGPKGDKGDTGATGATGPQGPQGKQGNTGATGATGPQGPQGKQGNAGATGQRGSRWTEGTAITGTSTTATVFSGTGIADALVNDMYLNTSTSNVYRCTVGGTASVAKWVFVGCIKGAKGDKGDKGATGATGPKGPQGEKGATGPQGPSGTADTTFTEAATLTKLTSGEPFKAMLGKLAKSVSSVFDKLDKSKVVNNQTTTVEGFALDARQANPNIDGSLAKQISDLNGSLKMIDCGESFFDKADSAINVGNDILKRVAFHKKFNRNPIVIVSFSDLNANRFLYSVVVNRNHTDTDGFLAASKIKHADAWKYDWHFSWIAIE